MRIRKLIILSTLAALLPAFVPAEATAQAEPPAFRAGSWEFGLGAGLTYIDPWLRHWLSVGDDETRFTDTRHPTRRNGLLDARIGYNFTRNIGVSLSGTAATGYGVWYFTPGASVTYTVHMNDRLMPFILAGMQFTKIDGQNDRATHSTWGAHAGFGLRIPLNPDRLALRFDGRVLFEGYDEAGLQQHKVAYASVATVGLAYFVGGRRPTPAPVAAPCPACPPARPDTVRVTRVDTLYVPYRAPVPEVIVLRDTLVLQGVNFAFDEAVLTPQSRDILDRVAVELRRPQWANVRFEVAGHTSAIATRAYNMALSERRAEAVRAYLVSRGIADNRMVARGYGETQPLFANTREGEAWRNRRVELRRIQ